KPLFGLTSALSPIHETWKNDNLVRQAATSLSVTRKRRANPSAPASTGSGTADAHSLPQLPFDPRAGGRR
ncbi:hypothetical protein ACFSJ2_05875, partial [Pseudochelatococcus lubricantis]